MTSHTPPVLLYACFGVDPQPWIAELARALPEAQLRVWPEAGAAAEVEYVLAWNHPSGLLQQFPHLRAIFCLGAGVDRLLQDPLLPQGVPIVRMVDPSLVAGMNEFVLMRTLHYHRRMPEYAAQQRARQWRQLYPPLARERRVGIMGLGELGRACARSLVQLGFDVSGWSRTPKALPGVACHAGWQELPAFLARAEILVCLLPHTAETAGILSAATFAQLPRGACLINVARGALLVEEDLIPALDAGRLAGATLDVFRTEPLPPEHPFWSDPRITVIPHAAALTLPQTAARTVADNVRRHRAGQPLLNVVDVRLGY